MVAGRAGEEFVLNSGSSISEGVARNGGVGGRRKNLSSWKKKNQKASNASLMPTKLSVRSMSLVSAQFDSTATKYAGVCMYVCSSRKKGGGVCRGGGDPYSKYAKNSGTPQGENGKIRAGAKIRGR